MKWYVIVGIAALLTAVTITGAIADIITVDGDDSEWIGNPNVVVYDDTNGDVATPPPTVTFLPGYDIDYSYFLWDQQAGRAGFMFQTIDPTLQTYDGDVIEILINADDDKTTGGNWHEMQGADYRILWNFDGTAGNPSNLGPASEDQAYFQQWTGAPDWGSVSPLADTDVIIAWGNHGTDYSVVEATVNPDIFGAPNDFTWGFYLDNGGTASDDASPNTMNQRGYTPEPTTLVLLPIGLAGLAGWRRRRSA